MFSTSVVFSSFVYPVTFTCMFVRTWPCQGTFEWNATSGGSNPPVILEKKSVLPRNSKCPWKCVSCDHVSLPFAWVLLSNMYGAKKARLVLITREWILNLWRVGNCQELHVEQPAYILSIGRTVPWLALLGTTSPSPLCHFLLTVSKWFP
jgi:hypothetical protein